MSLSDEDTGVVDRLGKTKLVDLSLETALQEVLNTEGKDVIELHAGLVKDTDTDKTANQGVTLEKTLGVLLVESEKLTSSTTDLGKGELDTPDLTLVAQTIFTDDLELGVTRWGDDVLIREGLQDVSRDKLLLSGQAILTDEPTRRLEGKVSTEIQ